MNLSVIPLHLVHLTFGIGASLACFAVLYAGGAAILPRSWSGDATRGAHPSVTGAAAFAVWCWAGLGAGVRLTPLVFAFAATALAVLLLRCRGELGAMISSPRARATASREIATFVLLYTLTYLCVMPPVSGSDLPLAWLGNVDLGSYISCTRYLQWLGLGVPAAHPHLDFVYRQTPGVFAFLGLASVPFGNEPLSAAMPVQFACTALLGVIVARLSRWVFSASWLASVAIAGVITAGPFYRYVASNYFLSTLLATPVLLSLLWTTAVLCSDRRASWGRLALEFSAHYVLLLLLYPVFLLAAVPIQLVVVVASLIGSRRAGELSREWKRRLLADAGRPIGAIAAGLAGVGLLAHRHLAFTVDNLRTLSEKDVAGWPFDFVTALALFGWPIGPSNLIANPASRVWEMAGVAVPGVILFVVFFVCLRQKTTSTERAFVVLSAGALLAYVVYFLRVGPSYQQWKFASYFPLPLSFAVYAGGVRVLGLVASSGAVLWYRRKHRLVMGGLAVAALGMIGGNLARCALQDWPMAHVRGELRNTSVIDGLPYVQDVYIRMSDAKTTLLVPYFVVTKRLHAVRTDTIRGEPFSLDMISRSTPFLEEGSSCAGLGHRDTIAIAGVGCLLLAPPGIVPDTEYPFSQPLAVVRTTGLDSPEIWGRWNSRGTVQLQLSTDSRRAGVESVRFVNLRLRPHVGPRRSQQRLDFSWGRGHVASTTLAHQGWVSLPVHRDDWSGGRIWTLTLTLTLPDGIAPRLVDPSSQDRRPLAIGFEAVSMSRESRGTVVGAVGMERR